MGGSHAEGAVAEAQKREVAKMVEKVTHCSVQPFRRRTGRCRRQVVPSFSVEEMGPVSPNFSAE